MGLDFPLNISLKNAKKTLHHFIHRQIRINGQKVRPKSNDNLAKYCQDIDVRFRFQS